MRLLRFVPILFVLVLAWLAPAPAAGDSHMAVTGVAAESESDTPRICLAFSHEIEERGVRYEDYVRLEPAVSGDMVARGKRLCIAGVEHGVIYRVTVRRGLPDRSGERTGASESFNVSVPDRTPAVAFNGSAYILPRAGGRDLPVETVNVESIDFEVLRINDRNLMSEINDGRIGNLISKWDARQIASVSGELVWRGVVEIEAMRNSTVTTTIPISEILDSPEPGIYVATAIITGFEPRYERQEIVTQWLVVSDIAMSSFLGADGLHVFLRSFASALPMAGVELRLFARNNTELGRATTDADGMASFAPGLVRGAGGAGPAAVMAVGQGGDFNFHSVTRPAFDLTDRGVGGREAPGPIDAFLYTDRGVYRPGETVHLMTLARDDKAVAVGSTPLILRVFRPDGVEHDRFTLNGRDEGGGHHLALPLSAAARTGLWIVRAYVDPDGAPVGSARFQVEDFVPERMEVTLEAADERLEPGVDNAVDVDAQFLYGAPAADLRVEGEIVLREDANPYPMHMGFRFGLVQEEWRATREELATVRTDMQGRARLAVRLDQAPETSRPLRAVIRASVAEAGGRAVSRTLSLPLRAAPFAIGIRPLAGDRWIGEGQEARFKVIAVDHDGTMRPAEGLVAELFRERYEYHWYYRNSSWNYKVLFSDRSLSSETLSLRADAPGELAFNLDWGRYRVEVYDEATGAATSVRFQVGWYASPVGADVPDKLEIALDKESYRAGETARVHISPPFAGEVLLTVAGNRLYATRTFAVPEEGRTVELMVGDDWDAGAYITATVFRPADAGGGHGPARAIGVAWLAQDFGERTLAVTIDAPERITPRQTIDIGLTVAGAAPGARAFVTLAAVDEGILQLTGFATPSPEDHYFGKRRLAVELRDDYGRLIEGADGQPGRLRQGGDVDAADRNLGGLDASSIKTVSLFSGIVRLDKAGRARISLDIPDFNGRLRLMAVAWDRNGIGQGESRLTVRDALVSQLTLPRFLAPGDEGGITLTLHNVDGAAGAYRVRFTASGAAGVSGESSDTTVDLGEGERNDMSFTLVGEHVGVAGISLTIEGPDGFAVERDWELAVRPAQTLVTRHMAERLAPGESETFDAGLLRDFIPGTGEVLLSVSRYPDFDIAGLLKSLDRYPYGCAEQTTSRALPLLYVSEVAEAIGLAENGAQIRARVQKAIGRVLSMQRSDGSFGMWSSQDSREDWLSGYVMDFLTQAREKDYLVPDFAYRRGLQWLAGRVAGDSFSKADLPATAYAVYVLARAGESRLSNLRYLHDVYLKDVPTALGRAQLGAALALHGDTRRAESAFAAAPRVSGIRLSLFGSSWRRYWDYGSRLRDAAGIVYLAASTGTFADRLPDLANRLNELRQREKYLSTQEKAWLLLVAAELQGGEPMSIALDGRDLGPRDKPFYLQPGAGDLAEGVEVENRGDQPVWRGLTVSGVPARPMRAERRGFAISRAFYTLDGKRVKLKDVRRSDVIVVVINGEATDEKEHQALVIDLLPAGFEIENERLAGGREDGEMAWLPELTQPRHVEKRDDRFVAAVDLDRRRNDFTLAYIVRAVTTGSFVLPAVYVEDMYKPQYYARTSMGRVRIRPRE